MGAAIAFAIMIKERL